MPAYEVPDEVMDTLQGPSKGTTTYDLMPEEWRPRHEIVVQLQLCGLTNDQICKETGYSQQRVSIILRTPQAAAIRRATAGAVADNLKDVQARLALYANEALDEIIDEMRHSEDERIRQKAALNVLASAGYGKVERRISAKVDIDSKMANRILQAQAESAGGRDISYAAVLPSAPADPGEGS